MLVVAIALILISATTATVQWNHPTLDKEIDLGLVDSHEDDFLSSVDADMIYSQSNFTNRGYIFLGHTRDDHEPTTMSIRSPELFLNLGNVILDAFHALRPATILIVSDGDFINRGRIFLSTRGARDETMAEALHIRAENWKNEGVIVVANGDADLAKVSFTVPAANGVIRNGGSISLHRVYVVMSNTMEGKGCTYLGAKTTVLLDVLKRHDQGQVFFLGPSLRLKLFNFEKVLQPFMLKTANIQPHNSIEFENEVESVVYGADLGVLTVKIMKVSLIVYLDIGLGYSQDLFRLNGRSLLYGEIVDQLIPDKCVTSLRIYGPGRDYGPITPGARVRTTAN